MEEAILFLLEYVAKKQPDVVYQQQANRLIAAMQAPAPAEQPAPAPKPKPVIPSAFKTVEDAADVAAAKAAKEAKK